MTVRFTPLDELNTSQLDKVLAKFQLISNHHNTEEKIKIVKCIGLYDTKLGQYETSEVLVGFNKSGNFHDMKSTDETVKLLEDICTCNTCGRKVDNKDVGIRCCGCTQFFHNRCTSSPLSAASFNQLVNTPEWVKVFCPKCMVTTEKSEECLQDIKQCMDEIKTKVEVNLEENKMSYSQVANKNLTSNLKKANELVETLARQNNQTNDDARKEKTERSRVMRLPKDPKILISADIRKEFNKTYPEILLRNARFTAGGSIVLEFDDVESAESTQVSWNKTLFGGNAGLEKFNSQNSSGIVKYVYVNETEEEIEEEIKRNYPNTEHNLFKKDGNFTGMIQIKFKDEDELKQVIENKFDLFHRKFIIEPFKQKPKVIKCNTCQRFGHVSRICRNKNNPVCGKCSKVGHESENCNIPEEEYKCYHCHQNHITGSYKCGKVQEKLDEIMSRRSQYES